MKTNQTRVAVNLLAVAAPPRSRTDTALFAFLHQEIKLVVCHDSLFQMVLDKIGLSAPRKNLPHLRLLSRPQWVKISVLFVVKMRKTIVTKRPSVAFLHLLLGRSRLWLDSDARDAAF